MNLSSIVVLTLPLALGCNRDQPHAPPTIEPAAATPAPAPFTGTLTVSRLVTAKGVVHLREPWPAALAKVEATLGAPTKIVGAKYTWAAMTGDACATFAIEQRDGAKFDVVGPIVGMVQDPATSFPSDPPLSRKACLDVLGKGLAAEDPAIAGPLSTANEVKDVVDNAPRARSKWDGKLIRIAGKVASGTAHSSVTLADARDSRETIYAPLKHGSPDPALGKPAILECTVKIHSTMNGLGEERPTASLADCSTL